MQITKDNIENLTWKDPLTQLKPAHLHCYYSEKLLTGRFDSKGPLNPRTVRHHHMTLHNALQSAVKWGLLSRNPADAIDLPHTAARIQDIHRMHYNPVLW